MYFPASRLLMFFELESFRETNNGVSTEGRRVLKYLHVEKVIPSSAGRVGGDVSIKQGGRSGNAKIRHFSYESVGQQHIAGLHISVYHRGVLHFAHQAEIYHKILMLPRDPLIPYYVLNQVYHLTFLFYKLRSKLCGCMRRQTMSL